MHDRQKDFQLIFLMKEPDSYIFTAESNQLSGKLNITSHKFHMGYITQLWKDSKDIEFVKQTIGHRNLATTSAYVNKLSD